MREINTEIEINASAEVVWDILTDFPSFPQWNPFIRNIEGEIKVGSRLEVYLKLTGTKGMNFQPGILSVKREKELRWLGHLWISGLFDGEHIFRIESLDPNRVLFVQHEIFRGLLTPIVFHLIEKDTRRAFEEMNEALKIRSENLSKKES
ncbi:SRPBCC family protein [Methanococcoides sp. FTZ1]|uniref:SRPBCC family protein n=1 Tax=Methanococcoides sp. FTZ1 TaxID=3439061 RepID=UPI003F84D6A9